MRVQCSSSMPVPPPAATDADAHMLSIALLALLMFSAKYNFKPSSNKRVASLCPIMSDS
jgi:hypothetical protein